MSLERELQELPKPLLAGIVILVAIVAFFVLEPPHTICDSQSANFKANQEGILFPTKVNKKTYVGSIQRAMESCQHGNSSGSCYDYFGILRRAATSLKNGSSECQAQILGLNIPRYARVETYDKVRDPASPGGHREVLTAVDYRDKPLRELFADGIEVMTMKAWGEKPPEPGPDRFGWFQMSEMNAFCHVRDVVLRGGGDAYWSELRRRILVKLPGAKPEIPMGVDPLMVAPPKAVDVMGEQAVWELSLLSAGCDGFR